MFKDAPVTIKTITTALDNSSDCVSLLDTRGTLLWMNRSGLAAMEIDDIKDVLGSAWADLWPPETACEFRQAFLDGEGLVSRVTALGPTLKGTDKWWDVTVVPLTEADGALGGFIATSRDVTRREVESRSREILLQEMRHRQGNTLSLASTLMTVHARDRPELAAFAQEMGMRLAAVGRAQAVLGTPDRTSDVFEREDVENLLRVLVAPMIGPDCELVIDVEPGVRMDPDKLDAVGMVVSELAVNSAKHGAFTRGGRLGLTVMRTDAGVEFQWQERSHLAVTAIERDGGQGQSLMGRIAQVHGGVFSVDWRPSGQVARLLLPEADSIDAPLPRSSAVA